MKVIIVKWYPEEGFYKKAMKVIYSTHPRFVQGYRFDFGFMQIASEEGYTIEMYPMDKEGEDK